MKRSLLSVSLKHGQCADVFGRSIVTIEKLVTVFTILDPVNNVKENCTATGTHLTGVVLVYTNYSDSYCPCLLRQILCKFGVDRILMVPKLSQTNPDDGPNPIIEIPFFIRRATNHFKQLLDGFVHDLFKGHFHLPFPILEVSFVVEIGNVLSVIGEHPMDRICPKRSEIGAR